MKRLIITASVLVLSGMSAYALEVINNTGKTLDIKHKYHVHNESFNELTIAAKQKQKISKTNTFLEIAAYENRTMVAHCPDKDPSEVNTVTFESENNKVICTIK